MQLSSQQCRELLCIAAAIIRGRLGDSSAKSALLGPGMPQPAGCFVTLHGRENRALRGCIGRINPAEPLSVLLRGAAESVLDDPRFAANRVTLAELEELTLEISFLSPLMARPTPLDFDPQSEGIHLTIAERGGLFLPQVARETGWTREQLLARLCVEKLGLAPTSWQESGAKLQAFTVVIAGPEPFDVLVETDAAAG